MNPQRPEDGRRLHFLQALGIGPIWQRRDVSSPDTAGQTAAPTRIADAAKTSMARVRDATEEPMVAVALPPRATAMHSAWDEALPASLPPATGPRPQQPVSSDAEIALMDWSTLQTAVAQCTRCSLCRTRQHTVFGSGDAKARWLFVGEGPGRTEDQQGLPFVGPAGELLNNLLAAIGLERTENTFIANVVKCRPTDAEGHDRAPTAEESAACRPYLDRQIALLKPTTIVALGKVAAVTLLKSDPKAPLATLRGTVHDLSGIPLVVTYHPAYLLRKPLDKSKSWRDLCLATDAYRNFGKLPI